MTRPVIGLSCYNENAQWGAWNQPAALIPWNYVEKLQSAGAAVVILPPDSAGTEAIVQLDGLVLAGGADIDPNRYGQQFHDTTDKPRTLRDASEIALYLSAREHQLPVLGICRGLQIMTVAHGGSLHQHLPDVVGTTAHRDAPGTFNDHLVTFKSDSLICRLTGVEQAITNSSHHQGIDECGSLVPTAWAADGIIEACEDPTEEFVLGVQWHPEASSDPIVSDQIFSGFIRAASR